MSDRSQRIIESAIELAERGGFEGVRLRDVASHAQVALGTLYRRFRSKEAILVAALEMETARLEQRLARRPIANEDRRDRVIALFSRASQGLLRRPNLSKAILRAVVSGDPEIREKAKAFHQRMTDLVAQVVVDDSEEMSVEAQKAAYVLQQAWFAAVVGWMGGIHTPAELADRVRDSADLVLAGLEVRAKKR